MIWAGVSLLDAAVADGADLVPIVACQPDQIQIQNTIQVSDPAYAINQKFLEMMVTTTLLLEGERLLKRKYVTQVIDTLYNSTHIASLY